MLDHGPEEAEVVAGHGPPVRWVPATTDTVTDTARAEAARLRKRERLDESQLAVLHLFANPHRGDSDAVARADAAGELVETNAATFKGLERPAVVLGLDLDPEKTHRAREVARTAYVAATRARSLLTVVGDPDVARAYGFGGVADRLSDASG